ncbi:MAG: hypothetical protein PHS60_18230 [Zavarzinia sp.]|nr:hypothetical protein [Zavarzinia sp.]
MLGVLIGADGPYVSTIAGVDMGVLGILVAWTVTGGAIVTLAAIRPDRNVG